MQLSSKMPSLAYKIRDKQTGLFKVKRAGWKKWDKLGDVYATLGIAKSTLGNIISNNPFLAKDVEIVAYELREIGPHIEPLL